MTRAQYAKAHADELRAAADAARAQEKLDRAKRKIVCDETAHLSGPAQAKREKNLRAILNVRADKPTVLGVHRSNRWHEEEVYAGERGLPRRLLEDITDDKTAAAVVRRAVASAAYEAGGAGNLTAQNFASAEVTELKREFGRLGIKVPGVSFAGITLTEADEGQQLQGQKKKDAQQWADDFMATLPDPANGNTSNAAKNPRQYLLDLPEDGTIKLR